MIPSVDDKLAGGALRAWESVPDVTQGLVDRYPGGTAVRLGSHEELLRLAEAPPDPVLTGPWRGSS